ncbi:hypothetical protein E4U34_003389 [Claviceps purpurea]|nr:hypothetical protein E4U34_003389 [Claviceps purpurea]
MTTLRNGKHFGGASNAAIDPSETRPPYTSPLSSDGFEDEEAEEIVSRDILRTWNSLKVEGEDQKILSYTKYNDVE